MKRLPPPKPKILQLAATNTAILTLESRLLAARAGAILRNRADSRPVFSSEIVCVAKITAARWFFAPPAREQAGNDPCDVQS
jgi:hypothetical protein